MAATVGLFLGGAAFGYYYVLPGAMQILIVDFGKNFTPMVTIEEYSSFFLSIILGLGTVSYTHLDVYKRQGPSCHRRP